MSQGAAKARRKAAQRRRLGPKSSVVAPGKGKREPLAGSGFSGKISKTAKKSIGKGAEK